MKTSCLIILGPIKTFTSSMVNLINAHPEILITYECFPDFITGSHGRVLYKVIEVKEEERIKQTDSCEGLKKKLVHIFSPIKYRYIGDKWPVLGAISDANTRMEKLHDTKVIYMVRDLRTWLSHKAVQREYPDSLYSAALLYVYSLIKSYSLANCCRIRAEDFVDDLDGLGNNLSQFLDVDFSSYIGNYWNINERVLDNNKKKLNWWWPQHPSSLTRPVELSTPKVKQNVIIDDVLCIFDKYYNNLDDTINTADANKDIDKLLDICGHPDYLINKEK
jgi:hypothetical protein